ncbi:MAG: HlyD family efflux transporter periplasmic adaptor subunit [Cyanobacteria bacterium P01_F01_bin.33]
MEAQLPKSLPTATPEDFLPPIGAWATIGGVALLGIFGGAIGLAAVLQYPVTVKARVAVRPVGEERRVEAAIDGVVGQIEVRDNDAVGPGTIIARLVDEALHVQQRQLSAERDRLQQQVAQTRVELAALDAQVGAERRAGDRAEGAATAQIEQLEREFQERQSTSRADLREAAAAVQFAQDEFDRFRQLEETGALSALQISEKAAALETALARLERTRALLNPSRGAIVQAQQERERAIESGVATLAELEQQRAALVRQEAALQQQIQATESQLGQVELELEKLTVRSPIAGTIQALTVRNPGQVVEEGEMLARVTPSEGELTVKAQVGQAVIAKIEVGQEASIRLDSCAYTDFGILSGRIRTISPDAERGEGNTAGEGAFYEVAIAPETLTLRKGDRDCRLQAGMEGRADIITRRETILQTWLRTLRLASDL